MKIAAVLFILMLCAACARNTEEDLWKVVQYQKETRK